MGDRKRNLLHKSSSISHRVLRNNNVFYLADHAFSTLASTNSLKNSRDFVSSKFGDIKALAAANLWEQWLCLDTCMPSVRYKAVPKSKTYVFGILPRNFSIFGSFTTCDFIQEWFVSRKVVLRDFTLSYWALLIVLVAPLENRKNAASLILWKKRYFREKFPPKFLF